MQADAGVQRDGLENVAGQGTGEVAANQVVLLAGRLAAVHQVWAAGDVHHSVGKRFVQRHGGFAEPADPGLVAQGGPQHLTEGNGHVLHCVVDVDVGVARGLDRHVDQGVLAQGREHVVVERHGSIDVRYAGAVEVDLHEYGGLAGGTLHAGGPGRSRIRSGGTHGEDPLCERKRFKASSAAVSSLGGKRGLARKDALQGRKEGCGFRLSACRDPKVAGDSHVADEDARIQELLPDLVRVFQAPEKHVVGVRRGRGEAHPGQFRHDPVALLLDILDISHQRFTVLEGGQGRCLGDRGQVVRQAHQPQRVGDLRAAAM